ncbi:putative phosphothreonine lyase domain-containing protein, partial [Caballeronia temeraria]|uniref:putative phosphothreonine lyase domain-containing protein n=1 Tax=Caballeronia temeraria TaxID=1777137 RepID=UPI000A9B0AC6
MKEGIVAGERLFRKSDKPSEDLSCNWHYKKSPSYNDFASTDVSGKWCICVSPTDVDEAWSKISGAIEKNLLICAKVGGDPLPWMVKQLNFEWIDSLRFGRCRELSTAGRRVAYYDHDAGRRWTTR